MTDSTPPNWPLWGPYLSERAWGTVREDYSAEGRAWDFFPHEHARSRVYRWGEDGLAGLSDVAQRLCFALSLWNGRDPILKERIFGLTGEEGNHGEDAKEYWWYHDALPTHEWLQWRYHYPQDEFPYADLVRQNAVRSRSDPEFELLDTGIFDEGRYWVIEATYAKRSPTDLIMSITVRNVGPETATLHLIPTLWFRNTWSWDGSRPPELRGAQCAIVAEHPELGTYHLDLGRGPQGPPTVLCCDNETNTARLFGSNVTPMYPKDGIGDHIIHGAATVNPEGVGTKAAAWYQVTLEPGATSEIRLRLHQTGADGSDGNALGPAFDAEHAKRQGAAEAFYDRLIPDGVAPGEAMIARQAFAGMIWSKQFYRYEVARWLDGDPAQPPPPTTRLTGRNADWRHLNADDIVSMPDTWEYPWFAAWDLAFQAIALARVDPEFAKTQLQLLLTDRYQHPNGAIPAYEWNFGDVNPPVQAWAALQIHAVTGGNDDEFLQSIFPGLLRNLNWWFDREDSDGNNLFAGGFLGLDNISPINRSDLPRGVQLEQSDATAWMILFCNAMHEIAERLNSAGRLDATVVDDLRTHADAIGRALADHGLWDEAGGFFYDLIHSADGADAPVRVRSAAGLIPLLSAAASWPGVLSQERLIRLLEAVFEEKEFLSPNGLRSLSARYRDQPYTLTDGDLTATIAYEPGDSDSGMFGGNSNWRGPIWMPLNYLAYHALCGLSRQHPDLTLAVPTGSANQVSLADAAENLRRRLISLYLPSADGNRPANGTNQQLQHDPNWRDNLAFYEYFHGDTGAGLGASHQTGWTGLIADLILRVTPES